MTARDIAKLEQLHRENPDGTTFAPLAEALRRSGDPERALALLHAGLSIHPDHAPGRIVLGRCHLDLEDHSAAESAFAAVLDHDPGNPIALQALADLAERHERYEQSVGWLENLLEVDPSNTLARDQLARVTAAKETAEAIRAPADVGLALDEPRTALDEWAPVEAEPEVIDLGMADADAGAEVSEAGVGAPETDDAIERSEVMLDADAEPVTLDAEPDVIEWEPEGIPDAVEPLEEGEVEPLAAVVDAGAMVPVDEPEDEVVGELGEEPPGFDELQEDESGMTVEPLAAIADAQVMVPAEETSEGDSLAPEVPVTESPPAGFSPDLPPFEEAAGLAEPVALPPAADEGMEPKLEPEPVATETMAELYLSQGHRQEALGIYRLLLADQPENQRLKDKVAALEEEPVHPPAESGAGTSAYAAATRGGQSVTDFFRVLLDSRPESTSQAGAGDPGPGHAEPAAEPAGDRLAGVPPAGEPTRPAQDRLSLSAIFGEDASPVPPAVPRGAAIGPKTGRFSFDAFFGAQRGEAPVPTDTGSASPELNEDDLDDFQVWLQNLKG